LNGRTITRAGVGTQMERLPVQEGGLQQGALGSLEWLLKSSTDGAKCRRSGMCQADVDVRKLPDLRETKKIGQDRLTPAIFISTIGVPVHRGNCRYADRLAQSTGRCCRENHPKMRIAMVFHSTSPSALQAVRQAAIEAVASTGC